MWYTRMARLATRMGSSLEKKSVKSLRVELVVTKSFGGEVAHEEIMPRAYICCGLAQATLNRFWKVARACHTIARFARTCIVAPRIWIRNSVAWTFLSIVFSFVLVFLLLAKSHRTPALNPSIKFSSPWLVKLPIKKKLLCFQIFLWDSCFEKVLKLRVIWNYSRSCFMSGAHPETSDMLLGRFWMHLVDYLQQMFLLFLFISARQHLFNIKLCSACSRSLDNNSPWHLTRKMCLDPNYIDEIILAGIIADDARYLIFICRKLPKQCGTQRRSCSGY